MKPFPFICLLVLTWMSVHGQQVDSILDIRDAKVYPIVKIGQQWWLQENLNTGIRIGGTASMKDNGIIEKYCYNDDPANCKVYGGLYQWDEMMDYQVSDDGNPGHTQGICPAGWHLPSDQEWQELEISLGMSQAEAAMVNVWRGTDQGTQLMKGGSSGYNALLSGRRYYTGSFSLINSYEYIWTSAEDGSNAWRRCLREGSADIGRWNTFPKSCGFSVRCLRDAGELHFLAVLDSGYCIINGLEFSDSVTRQEVIIFNASMSRSITIQSITNSTGEYSTDRSSAVLSTGDSINMWVSFHPPYEGEFRDTVLIGSDDLNRELAVIPLHGLATKTDTGQAVFSRMLADSNRWYVWNRLEGIFVDLYSAKGDTLVGEKWCKKLFMPAETRSSTPQSSGYIREDTIERKVYVKYPWDAGQEMLLYDFSLEDGDTIIVEQWDGCHLADTYVVDSVGETLLLTGEKRRTLYLRGSAHDQAPVWVEGIGSLAGLFSQCQSFSPGSEYNTTELGCFFFNDQLIYQSAFSSSLDTCDYFISGLEDHPAYSPVTITPNPASGLIRISSPDRKLSLYTAEIYSLSGILVKKIALDHTAAEQWIDLSDLQEGLYFIRLRTDNQSQSGKIIKLNPE
jgi:uncharacterized protein (TIGR02145 family)